MDEVTHEEKQTPTPGRALERVKAYQLAVAASDAAWPDATLMKSEQLLADVAPQLVRAVGSIGANIAEGYVRRSSRDRIRYYEYALGSVEESVSWYGSARRIIDADVFIERIARFESIRRLLLVMIANERRGSAWNHPRPTT